jgi:hypothetical protein
MKNLKIIGLLIFLFVNVLKVKSQTTHESEKYHIQFTTTQDIAAYETESERVIGFENDDFAVDIEVFKLSEVNATYLHDLNKTTRSIASQLALSDVQQAIPLDNLTSGYYVRATDIDGVDVTPVFVGVIYNKTKELIYEITVYCYDLNLSVGRKTIESFRLLE